MDQQSPARARCRHLRRVGRRVRRARLGDAHAAVNSLQLFGRGPRSSSGLPSVPHAGGTSNEPDWRFTWNRAEDVSEHKGIGCDGTLRRPNGVQPSDGWLVHEECSDHPRDDRCLGKDQCGEHVLHSRATTSTATFDLAVVRVGDGDGEPLAAAGRVGRDCSSRAIRRAGPDKRRCGDRTRAL